DFVLRFLTGRGYDVRVNDPYKGVELVRRHGRPSENRHSLQIEVNRKLYMNEDSFDRNANFPKLKSDLDALVAALATCARERAGLSKEINAREPLSRETGEEGARRASGGKVRARASAARPQVWN